jgi:hypothetical protein
MPFVNTISFAHRFSDDKAMEGYCSYKEVNHTYSGDGAQAVSRAFFQFMMACGYLPHSVIEAMQNISSEYKRTCGYNKEKTMEE